MADLIDRNSFLKDLKSDVQTVRYGRCEYCKGRSYIKEPFTVIAHTMKRVKFCPYCGAKMDVGVEND